MNLICLSIALFIGCACLPVHSEVFTGPGPDPACGGSELKIEKTKDRINFIEHTVFASSRSIVEQFLLNSEGNWDITVLVYLVRWTDDKPLTADKIVSTNQFKNTEIEKGRKTSEEIGFRDFDWQTEPNRLIKYFTENQATFEKQKG